MTFVSESLPVVYDESAAVFDDEFGFMKVLSGEKGEELRRAGEGGGRGGLHRSHQPTQLRLTTLDTRHRRTATDNRPRTHHNIDL